MTTHKDFLEHKTVQGMIAEFSPKDKERFDIECQTAEFLRRGGKIKVLEGFERACDGSKPMTTINHKKMSERENRERMKKEACAYYKNGKELE